MKSEYVALGNGTAQQAVACEAECAGLGWAGRSHRQRGAGEGELPPSLAEEIIRTLHKTNDFSNVVGLEQILPL